MKKKVLDITNHKCPMSYLKTKEFLNKNKKGKRVILIRGEKDYQLLSNALKKNFKILTKKSENDIFEIELN